MIVIACINGSPQRELTVQELKRVKKTICDGINYTHYEENDQTPADPTYPDAARWLEMKKDLLNSGAIYTKMRTAANTGSYAGNLISVFEVLNLGIEGHPDESGLQSLLSLTGWGFTQNQKDTINQYFINNGFNISI